MRLKRQFGDIFDRETRVPLGWNERVGGYFCNLHEYINGNTRQVGVFTTLFGPTFAVVDDASALSEEELDAIDEFMEDVAKRQKDWLTRFVDQSIEFSDALKNAGFVEASGFVDQMRERAQEKGR